MGTPQLLPDPETRDMARACLAVNRQGKFELSKWERDTLWRIRRTVRKIRESDKQFVARTIDRIVDRDWEENFLDGLHSLSAQRYAEGEYAARVALGIPIKIKGEKKLRGEPVSRKKKPELREVEIPCPACRTGANLYCWATRNDAVFWHCWNRFCTAKLRGVRAPIYAA